MRAAKRQLTVAAYKFVKVMYFDQGLAQSEREHLKIVLFDLLEDEIEAHKLTPISEATSRTEDVGPSGGLSKLSVMQWAMEKTWLTDPDEEP